MCVESVSVPGGDENTGSYCPQSPSLVKLSQEIQLCLFQRTLTDTCTGVPYAIDTCNLRKTVGCSLE